MHSSRDPESCTWEGVKWKVLTASEIASTPINSLEDLWVAVARDRVQDVDHETTRCVCSYPRGSHTSCLQTLRGGVGKLHGKQRVRVIRFLPG